MQHHKFINKNHLKRILTDIQHFLIQHKMPENEQKPLPPAMGAHVLVTFFAYAFGFFVFLGMASAFL
ncbi:MAG: hypothetical protein GQ532_18570 [Methylomarinum sp.]|nr:hypothetical protein [Methylomarinum sp.]